MLQRYQQAQTALQREREKVKEALLDSRNMAEVSMQVLSDISLMTCKDMMRCNRFAVYVALRAQHDLCRRRSFPGSKRRN